jgi:predicted RNA methylase
MNLHGINRDTIDKFYTKPEIAKKLIKTTKKYVKDIDLIIEPSAGNGSFSKYLYKISENAKVESYDIEPESKDIKTQDFLKLDQNTINQWKKHNILLIGNPPFGRQSSLAKKFIKIGQEFSKYIAFILSKSFKKPSMYNVFSKNFHKIHEEDLEKNSFLLDEKEYNVPCIFQIWEKKSYCREVNSKESPYKFEFTKDKELSDFSFRRVGVNAGFVDTNSDKSEQSHYFIVLDIDNKDDIINKLSAYKWTCDDTIGPKSISKSQLIPVLNNIIKNEEKETLIIYL